MTATATTEASLALTYFNRKVLKDRRVRHADGREGAIVRMDRRWGPGENPDLAAVRWDGLSRSAWFRADIPAAELTLLDPPPLTVTVHTRRALYRGTKEQVAERLAAMPPLSHEARAAGVERYVEFTNTAVGEKRWRIVEVGPAWSDDDVASTPSEAPGSERLRRGLYDQLYDTP